MTESERVLCGRRQGIVRITHEALAELLQSAGVLRHDEQTTSEFSVLSVDQSKRQLIDGVFEVRIESEILPQIPECGEPLRVHLEAPEPRLLTSR